MSCVTGPAKSTIRMDSLAGTVIRVSLPQRKGSRSPLVHVQRRWNLLSQKALAGSTALKSPEAYRGTMPNSRSEEHTSELQSLMRISYAVFCLKKKKLHKTT